MSLRGFLDLDPVVHAGGHEHGLSPKQIEHSCGDAIDYGRIAGAEQNSAITAIGADQNGRLLEPSAHIKPHHGRVYRVSVPASRKEQPASEPHFANVYHANTPLSNRAKRQFGLI